MTVSWPETSFVNPVLDGSGQWVVDADWLSFGGAQVRLAELNAAGRAGR
jgi:hypothetical protein